MRDALVEVLRRDLKDIALGFVSISDVEVSPDLRVGRVFVSGLKPEDSVAAVKTLNDARAKVRFHLGQRVRLRHTPELEFRVDDTSSKAGRIEELLQQVKPLSPAQEPESHDGTDGQPDHSGNGPDPE